MPVLVTFVDDWADEMYISGLVVDNTSKTVEESKAKLICVLEEDSDGNEAPGYVSLFFGTNESNQYESIEEVLECFYFQEITDEEFAVLKRLELQAFGNFPVRGMIG